MRAPALALRAIHRKSRWSKEIKFDHIAGDACYIIETRSLWEAGQPLGCGGDEEGQAAVGEKAKIVSLAGKLNDWNR